MNIYWLRRQDPNVEEFAWFGCVGTWGPPQVCPYCNAYLGTNLFPPYTVEIRRGCTRLGDFSDGGAPFLVNDRAAKILTNLSSTITFDKPQFVPSKFKKNVLQSGDVTGLVIPTLNRFVHLDIAASKLEECERSCSKLRYYRFKTKDLFFQLSAVGDATCFHVTEFGASRSWFCTQQFKDEFEAAAITNVRFELAGIAS